MRYKLKKDVFHGQISKELEEYGFFVADTSRLGHGFPDICISKMGVWALVELKTLAYSPKKATTPVKSASDGLRLAQIDFHSKAKGPIITAYNASQIVYEFNLLLKRREAWAIA